MSKGHGQRKYLQLLLAPNRGKLLVDLAEEMEMKPSALARDIIYRYLMQTMGDTYTNAYEEDNELWQQSVQNRLEGRALSKLLSVIRSSK